MLHLAVESAFNDLLEQWQAHENQDLRRNMSLVELAGSRERLDRARNRMQQLRIAIYPYPDEVESIVDSVWCEKLESVVHLRWADRDPTREGNFNCVCGQLVSIDLQRV